MRAYESRHPGRRAGMARPGRQCRLVELSREEAAAGLLRADNRTQLGAVMCCST